jgi:hypothetical protein
MNERPNEIPNGTRGNVDGKPRVYYDGYWIKRYEPPADSLDAKRRLIEALTRRLFNHVEHGINIPGIRLDEAREYYLKETDPERKRVNGAMLAGALFNRAAGIFTKAVELQAMGVEIAPDDTLMRQCGQCLTEALELGRMVRHRGGDEGIDEMWGEPFKAFSIPIEDFYESRYIKIAQTMRDIDRIAEALIEAVGACGMFPDVESRVREFARAARVKCETLRTDADIFEVWPAFVVAAERLQRCDPKIPHHAGRSVTRSAESACRLLQDGITLVSHIVRARVVMPKSTRDFLQLCHRFTCEQERKDSDPD